MRMLVCLCRPFNQSFWLYSLLYRLRMCFCTDVICLCVSIIHTLFSFCRDVICLCVNIMIGFIQCELYGPKFMKMTRTQSVSVPRIKQIVIPAPPLFACLCLCSSLSVCLPLLPSLVLTHSVSRMSHRGHFVFNTRLFVNLALI